MNSPIFTEAFPQLLPGDVSVRFTRGTANFQLGVAEGQLLEGSIPALRFTLTLYIDDILQLAVYGWRLIQGRLQPPARSNHGVGFRAMAAFGTEEVQVYIISMLRSLYGEQVPEVFETKKTKGRL